MLRRKIGICPADEGATSCRFVMHVTAMSTTTILLLHRIEAEKVWKEDVKKELEILCVKTSPYLMSSTNLHALNVSHAKFHENHFPVVYVMLESA